MEEEIVKKTIVIWHDCNPCITKSLINYLNWTYLTKHSGTMLNIVYLDELKERNLEESSLIKILRDCEALVYSCDSFHDIKASEEEWEVIKSQKWYAVSWNIDKKNNKKDEGCQLGLSIFTIKNVIFIEKEGLIKLMEDVRNKRSRL
ncbi:MAG TPA: hypothetical protein PLX95_01115 [bacterium]|nr:hypothetical protein [bacterium]